MDMGSSDPAFVISVLQAIESKVGSLQTGERLVDLAQTLAKLRRTVERLEQQSPEETRNDSRSSENLDEKQATDEDESGSDQSNNAKSANDEVIQEQQNSTIAIRSVILASTSQILAKISDAAIEMVHDLSAEEMRELLLVFLVTPFQVDDLVNSIDKETHRRLEVLGFKGPAESVQDLARRAFDSSVLASNTLSGESESTSTVDTIKNGIKAIFGVHQISEVSEPHVAALTALAENAQRTTTLIRETLGRMEQIRQGTGADTESLLRGAEQGTVIELGRCQELAAAYRRIDFSTGAQRCRYDSSRRRDISKRILSRLFP